MLEQHLTALIRDYGKSLLYGRRTVTRANRHYQTPFDEGVRAARMGMEKDANPYSPEKHAYEDWEAGFESSLEAARACDLD